MMMAIAATLQCLQPCADVERDGNCCSCDSAYIPVRLLIVTPLTATLAVLPISCSC